MKWIPTLIVLLAAAPVPAQVNVLGVLETGDLTMAIDTTTFVWSTRPDAKLIPAGWGGAAGTAASSVPSANLQCS